MYNYNNFYPYQNNLNNIFPRKGIGNIKRINWSNILNNTQKTLNVINQAIPVYYQVKPIIGNAKTMFRMINSLKEDEPVKEKYEKKETSKGPVFFL